MIYTLYEKFQPWSATGSIFLISDPHFDDADCRIMNPNWLAAEDYLISLNRHLTKNDTLICLGDCGDLSYVSKLKAGYKVLIKGNHDDKGNSKYIKDTEHNLFDEVYEGPLFVSDRILLSHEPVNGLPFCLNIHGHCHGGMFEYTDNNGGRHLNIAADVVDWKILSLGQLIKHGILGGIKGIHRNCIDNAIQHSLKETK